MINSKYYPLLIIVKGFILEPCGATEDTQPFSYNDKSYNIHGKEEEKKEVTENTPPSTPLPKNKNIITEEIKRVERDITRYIKNRKEEKQLKQESFTDSEIEKEKTVVKQKAMIEDLKILCQDIKPELTDNEVDILINRIQLKYYPEDGDGI